MAKTAKTARSARKPANAGKTDNGQPREGPPDETTEDDEDGLELPVGPDEGTPLIPDDERVVNVPT
ncbi:MAG TPA: hypothetical protein VGJ72_02900 [Polaromonas sp.]|jgi:hypothetical protein